jgi:small-conductance mechanosensitive channel
MTVRSLWPTCRTFQFLAASGLILALTAIPAARAQDMPVASDAELSGADRQVSALSEAIEKWQSEIKAKEQEIADQSVSDEGLRAIPGKLEGLREDIVKQRTRLKPRLEDRRERLAKLGPIPKEGAPKESDEIAAQRKHLESEIAALDGRLRQADVLFVRAGQVIDQANDARRERFTESLFRPVPNFYSSVFPVAIKSLPEQFARIFEAVEERVARAWSKGFFVFSILLLAPFGAAFATHRFIRRLASNKGTQEAEEDPSLQDRGVVAIKAALWTCLPIWTALAALYLIATSAGLATPRIGGFLPQALLAIAWAVMLASLVRETLVPKDSFWKIIPSTEAVAWRVATLLWALIAVWLLDKLLVLKDLIVFTPYQISVLRSAVFAALLGLLVFAILMAIQSGPQIRRVAFSGWKGWLYSIVAVLAGVILLATLLGYVSLAQFIGTHAVSTAGVLWIMYLLHLAAESISSVSVISGQAIDDDLEDEENMGAPSLLTMRIIASLLLDIAILAVGLTVLLLLWRFDWVEVKGWIQAAFFGFQFGPLRISLQSVLVALGVFALGLALTRFVQRWVTGRVFAGRKAESGLRESVRIGIGYLGFVLAALAGISYLGVDFSNLAIIAGALSVGIGFGLQSIFNNFVSGLILLAERPIKIGDYIQVGDQEGTVKKISVRSTEIETIHRQSVIIPNATLITDPVSNWMHLDKSCRLDIPVGVDYGTDTELLRSTLLAAAKAHRGVLKQPPPVVHFAGFGDSSLDFELRVFLRDVRNRIGWSSELRFAILAALRDAGISIPFPQRDVHVKGGTPEGAA